MIPVRTPRRPKILDMACCNNTTSYSLHFDSLRVAVLDMDEICNAI